MKEEAQKRRKQQKSLDEKRRNRGRRPKKQVNEETFDLTDGGKLQEELAAPG